MAYESYNFNPIVKTLVGRTITGHTIGDDKTTITFDTTTGPVKLRVTGDCCSTSWIESLDDPDALLGIVTSIEHIDMPPGTYKEDDFDYLQFYGLKITTSRGRCVLEYRNESNGYYGGDIELDYESHKEIVENNW